MQRSSALKSDTWSNGMSDQLLVIVADRRSPSAVSGGTRPFAGSTISDVSRFGSPISAQWPMPILLRGDFLVVARVQAAQALDALGELLVGEQRAARRSSRGVAPACRSACRSATCLAGRGRPRPCAARVAAGSAGVRRGARFPATGREHGTERPARARRTSIGAVACSKPRRVLATGSTNPAPTLYTDANRISVNRPRVCGAGRRAGFTCERGVG